MELDIAQLDEGRGLITRFNEKIKDEYKKEKISEYEALDLSIKLALLENSIEILEAIKGIYSGLGRMKGEISVR